MEWLFGTTLKLVFLLYCYKKQFCCYLLQNNINFAQNIRNSYFSNYKFSQNTRRTILFIFLTKLEQKQV